MAEGGASRLPDVLPRAVLPAPAVAGIPVWLGGTDIPSYLGDPRRPRDMRSYLAGQ